MAIRVVRLLCKPRMSNFDTITAEVTILDIDLMLCYVMLCYMVICKAPLTAGYSEALSASHL